jgi:hypothetical protein
MNELYKISGKGDGLGCKDSYAVINSKSSKVVGCHATRSDAEKQIEALYANVTDANKSDGSSVSPASPSFTVDPKYPGVGIKRPSQGRAGGRVGSGLKSKPAPKPRKTSNGQNSDNNSSSGALSSGGPGGSLGY